MSSVTVEAVDSDTDFWGTAASAIQTGVSVSADKKITGTLTKQTGHTAITDVWGEGYFIGLAFDDFTEGLTYEDVKVGLSPTEGSGLVTLDSDKMGLFKVTDKNTQKLVVAQAKTGVGRLTEFYDLSGLTLD